MGAYPTRAADSTSEHLTQQATQVDVSTLSHTNVCCICKVLGWRLRAAYFCRPRARHRQGLAASRYSSKRRNEGMKYRNLAARPYANVREPQLQQMLTVSLIQLPFMQCLDQTATIGPQDKHCWKERRLKSEAKQAAAMATLVLLADPCHGTADAASVRS